MTENINLQKIASTCLHFGEFYEKAEAAMQQPQKYLKQQEANIKIAQIAQECLTFGQFLARMNSYRERGETDV